MVYHDRVYFYTVDVQKNDHLAKQMFDVIFGFYKPFPLNPRRPLHMLYMFIATCHFQRASWV